MTIVMQIIGILVGTIAPSAGQRVLCGIAAAMLMLVALPWRPDPPAPYRYPIPARFWHPSGIVLDKLISVAFVMEVALIPPLLTIALAAAVVLRMIGRAMRRPRGCFSGQAWRKESGGDSSSRSDG